MTLHGNRKLIPTPGYSRVRSDAQEAGLELTDGQALPVSAANEARLRWNVATSKLEVSLNGAAYVEVALAGAGGLVSDIEPGTVNPYGALPNSVLQGDGATPGGIFRADVQLGSAPALTGRIKLTTGDLVNWADGTSVASVFRPETYGAIGDVQHVTDGTTVATDATLTSASNPWVAGDVGKDIYIVGAGAAGVHHKTTIAAFTSAGSIELADVAVTSVAGTALVKWGTDDGPAIQLALDAAKPVHGTVLLSAGKRYGTKQNLGLISAVGVTIQGAGMGASNIEDLRGDDPVGMYTGALPTSFYGLISFVYSQKCTIAKLTIAGPTTAADIDAIGTTNAGRKATYFGECDDCVVMYVEAYGARDEGIYAQGDSPRWAVHHCLTHTMNWNGINLNANAGTGPEGAGGCRITNNVLYNAGLLLGGAAGLVDGNIIFYTDKPAGVADWGDMAVVDTSAEIIFSNNTLSSAEWSTTGGSGLSVFGTGNVNTSLIIQGNSFVNLVGNWKDVSSGAAITISDGFGADDPSGTFVIRGNSFIGCEGVDDNDHRMILLSDLAATAVVFIDGNIARGSDATFMRTFVKTTSVAAGAKVYIGNNLLDGFVTTFDVGSEAVFSGECHVSSITVDHTTNPNAIPAGVSRVLVDCSGGDVTCTMPAVARNADREVQFLDYTRSANAHNITIEGDGAETINGAANVVSTVNGAPINVLGLPDGSAWVTTAPVS